MKDKRDRKEFPYPEHLTFHGEKKPLCGSLEDRPILLEIFNDNPPECVCPKCRKVLATFAKYDWSSFMRVMGV
jgi:hypothetical protein